MPPISEITWSPDDTGPFATGPGAWASAGYSTGRQYPKLSGTLVPVGTPGAVLARVNGSGGGGGGGGTATQLIITQQPQDGEPLLPLTEIKVAICDAGGNIITTATDAVTLDIDNDPGTILSAVLSGTTTVSAVAGVATFSDVAINLAGADYTLQATSGTLTPDTSDAFDIIGDATEFYFQPVGGAGLTLYGATFDGHATLGVLVSADASDLALFSLPGYVYVLDNSSGEVYRYENAAFTFANSANLALASTTRYTTQAGAVAAFTALNSNASRFKTYSAALVQTFDINPGQTNTANSPDVPVISSGALGFSIPQTAADKLNVFGTASGLINYSTSGTSGAAALTLQAATATNNGSVFTTNKTSIFTIRDPAASAALRVDEYSVIDGSFVASHVIFTPAIANDYTPRGICADADYLAVLFESAGDSYFLTVALADWSITDNSATWNAEAAAMPTRAPFLKDKDF